MSKRILLQNGKILLDNENKVLTTEDGTSALKLIESGTTTYEQKNLTLQNPLENNKMYVINLSLADGSFSFILMVNNTGVVTSTLHYYGAWGDYVRLECLDLKTIQAAVSGENDVFGTGAYELYEVQGGGNSTNTKLKKQNYIKSIESKESMLNAYSYSDDNIQEFLNEPIVTFTQSVDIVVEQPRYKTNSEKPSLYRAIGGRKMLSNKTTLTFNDIFKVIMNVYNNDYSAILGGLHEEQVGARNNIQERYLKFYDYYIKGSDMNTIHMDIPTDTHNYRGFNTYKCNNQKLRKFNRNRFDNEYNQQKSQIFRFFLKPVINYEIISNNNSTHYNYITGTKGILIELKLQYDTTGYLEYLINYELKKIE